MAKHYGKGDVSKSLVQFGLHGWLVILYCALMFWFHIGMVNDGSNFTAPAVAANLGLETGHVLSMNSVAGICGTIVFIIVGQVNKKLGSRITSGILLIVTSCCYYFVGNASSIAMYTIALTGVVGCSMAAGYICGGVLVARWFPKRKGIVMGYTTMGHNLASAFYVPIIGALVGTYGVAKGVTPICIAACALGILGMILIRNNPQERGQNPDYVSDETYAADYDTSDDSAIDDGGWTTGKLLANKHMWLAAITTGMFQICSAGVMTQLVNRNVELGMTPEKAVSTMTVLALGGVVGSWFIGVLDEKLGTKRTMLGFAIWYAAALLINATNNMICVYISLVMIAVAIGGSANFTTSLPTAVFGRHGFDKVNSVIFPIQGCITGLSALINGQILLLTGELRYAYIVLAGVALIDFVLILAVNEHAYNRDWKVAHSK